MMMMVLLLLETFVEHWITKILLNRFPKWKSFGSTNLNSIAQHCFGVCQCVAVCVCVCVWMLSIKQLSIVSSLPSLPVHTTYTYVHPYYIQFMPSTVSSLFWNALMKFNPKILSTFFFICDFVLLSRRFSSINERESGKRVIEVERARMEGD